MKRILALIVILLFCAQTARADVLLSEDFQSGKTTGWKGNPGKGDIRLSRYKSNISLRLQGNAYAVRKVALKDSGRVLVQAAFAAQNLGPGEACLLEVSTAPQKWKALGRVQDGQDDGLSLHKVGGIIQTKTGQSLLVRLRVAGKRKTTTCWADNIRIVHLAKTRDLPEHIPFAAFFANKKLKSPYAGQAFAPSAQAQKPVQPLSGSLELSAPVRADKFEILKDEFGYDILSGKFRLLPTFRIGLVSDGETLIPVTRGPMQNTHPDREWLFEPGKIWREPGDEGWMRAALPFAFQERNANCIHNGLMSFLYRDGQISNAIVQIGSETCAYLKYNMWSRLHLDFRNVPPETAETVRKNYRKELSNRLPRRPIEELGSPELVAQIGSELEVNPENMTTYGYVKDKQLFASPCPTRFGAYPYCADLPLPSYSMAKSMVAAIGLMRLEKLYPGARKALISDYVPECTPRKWQGVTFENALDMSTGNYNSDVYDKDESSLKFLDFMMVETHKAKIKKACNMYKHRTRPGRKFVYHTTDSYILGTAMQAYLRQKTGNTKADYYQDLLVPIWQALHLSPLMEHTRRTRDEVAQPFTGLGLTLLGDDLARISLFLQNGGRIGDKSWLDEDLLAAALQKKPDDRGLRAINDTLKYRAGFWAYNAGPFLGCKGDVWIPNMSGFGGLASVLMPNGHVYYYISDGHDYAWRRAARASNQIKPFCETK